MFWCFGKFLIKYSLISWEADDLVLCDHLKFSPTFYWSLCIYFCVMWSFGITSTGLTHGCLLAYRNSTCNCGSKKGKNVMSKVNMNFPLVANWLWTSPPLRLRETITVCSGLVWVQVTLLVTSFSVVFSVILTLWTFTSGILVPGCLGSTYLPWRQRFHLSLCKWRH